MLINDVGSRNVYENKQNRDEMSGEMSDIYVKVTGILQRNADLEEQFAVNSIFETGFVRKFTATRTPRTPAGMGSFRPTCLRLHLALLRREASVARTCLVGPRLFIGNRRPTTDLIKQVCASPRI